MNVNVEIHTEKLQAKFDAMSPNLTSALARAMDLFAIDFSTYVKDVHLSDGNPLHQRSGNLKRSITIDPGVTQPGLVQRRVYSANPAAVYGRVHEFGLTVTRTIQKAWGKTLKTPRTVTIAYPERSFMRVSIPEQRSNFRARMDAAQAEALHE